MMDLYRVFRVKNKVIGSRIMSYEQFVVMAEDELFKPYIDSLRVTQ